jgi:beta-glucosidase
VELPWADDVKAILDMWYSGEGSGKATANLLFGLANPSGKLPVTFPYRLEDTPGYLNFPGENFKLIYEEGIFVGYRYYEKRNLKPRYAFGHGLSYTRFEYSDAKVSAVSFRLGMPLLVSVIVRNTGDCEGEEVVQLYVRDDHSRLKRPFKELKHFEKCKLKPGEQKTVVFHLSERDFEYYDPAFGDWIADSGNFDLMIGSSSDDIRAIVSVMIESPLKFVSEFKPDTHFMDIFANPVARKIFYEFMIGHGFLKPEQDCQFTDTVLESTFWGIAQYLDYMIPMQVTPEMVEELMQRINEATH